MQRHSPGTAPQRAVTLQLLWEEEYVECHPGGRTYGYTQFWRRYKDWAQTLKRSMRQQHRAGEKLTSNVTSNLQPSHTHMLNLQGERRVPPTQLTHYRG